jgi:hypothetical protein
MPVGSKIQADLARNMKLMGEEEFTKVWKEEFEEQEPPLGMLRQALEELEGKVRKGPE